MKSHSITFLQHAQARRMLLVSVSQHVQKSNQSPWAAWDQNQRPPCATPGALAARALCISWEEVSITTLQST